MNNIKGTLEQEIRNTIRRKGYSYRTEQTYVSWYTQFVRFHKMRHPDEMGAEEITRFLTHLAVNRGVSANTQNLALNALIFLYRSVLKREIEGIDAQRAKRPRKIPTVLSADEIALLLSSMNGIAVTQARLLYGCGLRLSECLELRIKDVDLAGKTIWVRAGKGNKDRCIELPKSLIQIMSDQIGRAEFIFKEDRLNNRPGVALPNAFAAKSPNAGTSWP